MGRLVIAAWFVLMVLFCSCEPMIGDSCTSSAECPTSSYCDLASPDGYCTISPCYPGECPEFSDCIEFPNGTSFCMASCSEDGDCREDYICKTSGEQDFCGYDGDD